MYGYQSKWNSANQLGTFMYEMAIDSGLPISENECHAIIKAYGWEQANGTIDENQLFSGQLHSFKKATIAIAEDVYGNHKGSQHAQSAAEKYLLATKALPPSPYDETNPAHLRFKNIQALSSEV